MTVTKIDGSASVSTTEYFLASGSTSQTPQTTPCRAQVLIDPIANVVAGDRFRARFYETINGTQRMIFETFIDGVSGVTLLPPFPVLVLDGWEASLLKVAGTARTISWSVRRETNDVNVASFTAGALTAGAFANNAITAAVIATDAIDADAIKTDAVTEIQTGLATASSIASVQTDTTALVGRLTSGRATGLDYLDAAVSSRAPASTAVSNANYTSGRAAALDNLDATVSSRASASSLTAVNSNVSAVGTAVAAVNADTDDIQSRLPAALDGAGNIKAAVQSLVANSITATVIATDAIDADAIKTDAVTEIQSGLATASSVAALPTAAAVASIQTDTTTLTGRVDVVLSSRATTGAVASVAADVASLATAVSALATASALSALASAVAMLPSTTAIRDSILTYAFRSGRTVRGHLRRVDALFFGKATDLLGTLAKLYQPGGSTVEFQATQDPGAGTRDEVDCTTSETP